jgi:tetratricopeptide (TPR) repeat protein
MLARDDEYVGCLERAHHAHLDAGEPLRAVRCAFWIAINLARRGEAGRAGGWLGRARRLIAPDRECAERGYLLLAQMLEHEAAGDLEAALAAGTDAAAIGERFDDADLLALAAQDVGILLIRQGRVREGLGLLDEAMVALTSGELSPIVNGFVYCGAIIGCQAAHEPRRAQEWTAALTRWCDAQPDMVSFTGTCLVHRAEIMQLHGAWTDALREARLAAERCALSLNDPAAGEARYRQGEVHRLRGEFGAAKAAYRDARRGGRDPQPGLALLRLAQGNVEAAAAAIRRLVGESTEPAARGGLLPAYVEIMLAAGDRTAARAGCNELAEIAGLWESPTMEAMAAHAQGAADLDGGDARAALIALRRAWRAWRDLDAPYEAARRHAGRPRVRGPRRRRDRRRGAGGRSRGLRPPPRGARHRAPGRARPPPGPDRPARPDAPRARGPAPRRRGPEQSRDRGGARHQRAHGRPPRPEHPRQARGAVADRGERVRVRARPRGAWSEMTTPPAARLADPGDDAARDDS